MEELHLYEFPRGHAEQSDYPYTERYFSVIVFTIIHH